MPGLARQAVLVERAMDALVARSIMPGRAYVG